MYQGELHIYAALLVVAGTYHLHELRRFAGTDDLHPGKRHGIDTKVVCQSPAVFAGGVAAVPHVVDFERHNGGVRFIVAIVRSIKQFSKLRVRGNFIERHAPDCVAALRNLFFEVIPQRVFQPCCLTDFVLGLEDTTLCERGSGRKQSDGCRSQFEAAKLVRHFTALAPQADTRVCRLATQQHE